MELKNTKYLKERYALYNSAPKGVGLLEVYATPSKAKQLAFADCIRLCQSLNGYDWTIVSHNYHSFSFGFLAPKPNGSAVFVYITRDHARLLDLDTLA